MWPCIPWLPHSSPLVIKHGDGNPSLRRLVVKVPSSSSDQSRGSLSLVTWHQFSCRCGWYVGMVVAPWIMGTWELGWPIHPIHKDPQFHGGVTISSIYGIGHVYPCFGSSWLSHVEDVDLLELEHDPPSGQPFAALLGCSNDHAAKLCLPSNLAKLPLSPFKMPTGCFLRSLLLRLRHTESVKRNVMRWWDLHWPKNHEVNCEDLASSVLSELHEKRIGACVVSRSNGEDAQMMIVVLWYLCLLHNITYNIQSYNINIHIHM